MRTVALWFEVDVDSHEEAKELVWELIKKSNIRQIKCDDPKIVMMLDPVDYFDQE